MSDTLMPLTSDDLLSNTSRNKSRKSPEVTVPNLNLDKQESKLRHNHYHNRSEHPTSVRTA